MNDLYKAVRAFNSQIQSAKEAANWFWGVLQGDFNEDQTPSQVIANVGISIAVSTTGVGVIAAWILDLRDFIACVYHIYEDGSKEGSFDFKKVSPILWIGLVIMVIGVIPFLGDVLKGVLRIIYLQFIKLIKTTSKTATRILFRKAIENSMPYIDELLAHEQVKKFLKAKGWVRPYKELARELKLNYKKITSPDQLLTVYDLMLQRADKIFTKSEALLPKNAKTQYQALKTRLKLVRDGFEISLKNNTQQLNELIEELIIALEKHDNALYKAVSGKMSTHYYGKALKGTKAWEEAKKLPFLKKEIKFKALEPNKNFMKNVIEEKIKKGYPEIDEGIVRTFHTINNGIIKGPAKLYRVIDPSSNPSGMFWVTEDVFKQLKNRNDWRDKLAVKVDWSANGQYVTLDIPAGKELKVWRGPAATQPFDESSDLKLFYQGGTEQIVFKPNETTFKVSNRKETNWEYVDNEKQLLTDRVIINLDGSEPRK